MNRRDILAKWEASEPAPDILKHHEDPDLLLQVLTQLSADELYALDLMLGQFGMQSFAYEKLLERAKHVIAGARLSIALKGLRQHGLVYAVAKTWGERLYFIPTDLFPLLIQCRMPVPFERRVQDELSLTKEAGRGIVYDLFYILSVIGQHGAPLTAKGALHKKHVQKLHTCLSITTQELSPLQLQYPHPDVLPSNLAFVLDLAMRLGLLFKTPETYRLQPERLYAWLSLPKAAMEERLWQLFLGFAPVAEVWKQHVVYQLANTRATASDDPSAWLAVDSLVNTLRSQPFNHDARRVAELHQEVLGWVHLLNALGWLVLADDGAERSYFRWVKEARNEDAGQLYVQPDFEVIVPPDVSFLIRWELASCAELVRMDHVSIYRLTKESYMRAVDQGHTAEHVIQFLAEKSRAGIPDTVELAVRAWHRQYGRAYFAEVTLLRCTDEQMAQQIRGMGSILPEVQAIGELDFLVPKDRVEAIRAMLDKAGITPKRGMSGDAFEDDLHFETLRPGHSYLAEETTVTFPGFIYTQQNVQYYELDMRLPTNEQLFPGLSGVPRMWLAEQRAYHPSTMKEIVEQAIAWEATIRLSDRMEERVLQPVLLQPEGEHWIVKGYIEGEGGAALESFSLSKWNYIQLRLPVQN